MSNGPWDIPMKKLGGPRLGCTNIKLLPIIVTNQMLNTKYINNWHKTMCSQNVVLSWLGYILEEPGYNKSLPTKMINTWTANHNTKVVGQNHAICTFQLCRIACDLCHSFPLLCAAPPSIPSHPAVVFAPARALLASCPAPPASPCRAAPPPDPPATAPTWTLTPWSADSSLLGCQVNVKNIIGSDKLLESLNVFLQDILIFL